MAQYFRDHMAIVTNPTPAIPTYTQNMVVRASRALFAPDINDAAETITVSMLRLGMHPLVRVAQAPGALASLAATFFGPQAPAAAAPPPAPIAAPPPLPVPVAAPTPAAIDWSTLTLAQWVALYS
jgi:hypothetical protein